MFEKFSLRARLVVVEAQQISRRCNHSYIGTEHLLLAVMAAEDDALQATLRSSGLDSSAVHANVEEFSPFGPTPVDGHIPFTPRAKEALERSLHAAELHGRHLVDTEHLWWALTSDADATAVKAIASCGASCDLIRQSLEQRWRIEQSASPPE